MSGFKFPDEIENETKVKGKPEDDFKVEIEGDGDDLKVEVVDTTPPEDRNIEPLNEEVKQELEKADTSADYSHNVKTKFKQYKKAWHDERRAKESADRERSEAVTLAQRLMEENKKLKGSVNQSQTALLDQAKKVINSEIDEAKRLYKEAYEAGDTEKMIAAQRTYEMNTKVLSAADNMLQYLAQAAR